MNIDEVLEQAQTDLFWLADDVRVVDRPEILYLSCDRPQDYLNVVLRFTAEDARIPALVAETDEAHATVASKWTLSRGNRRAGVERALLAGGYAPSQELSAYAIGVDAYRPRATPDVAVRAVTDIGALRQWVDVGARAFNRSGDTNEERLAAELARSNAPDARVHRFIAYDRITDAPLCAAGLSVFPSLRFGLLWAGGTVPEGRGRGAYSAVVAARLERARLLGIAAVGLYARVDTSAPIVAQQGFERHGAVTHWMRPARHLIALSGR